MIIGRSLPAPESPPAKAALFRNDGTAANPAIATPDVLRKYLLVTAIDPLQFGS
jgi:hypothetical protein